MNTILQKIKKLKLQPIIPSKAKWKLNKLAKDLQKYYGNIIKIYPDRVEFGNNIFVKSEKRGYIIFSKSGQPFYEHGFLDYAALVDELLSLLQEDFT